MNKHQELIDKKVAELVDSYCDGDLAKASSLRAGIATLLQETIDTVLEEERELIVNTFKSMQTRYPEFSLDLELFEGEIMFNTSRPF